MSGWGANVCFKMLNAGVVEDKLEGGNHRLELRNLESQFLGRLIRSLGVPKEERGVWGSQGGEKKKIFFLYISWSYHIKPRTVQAWNWWLHNKQLSLNSVLRII